MLFEHKLVYRKSYVEVPCDAGKIMCKQVTNAFVGAAAAASSGLFNQINLKQDVQRLQKRSVLNHPKHNGILTMEIIRSLLTSDGEIGYM